MVKQTPERVVTTKVVKDPGGSEGNNSRIVMKRAVLIGQIRIGMQPEPPKGEIFPTH